MSLIIKSAEIKPQYDSDQETANIVNYKGQFFGEDTDKKYYEGGAHFCYKELCKKLLELSGKLSPSRIEKEKNSVDIKSFNRLGNDKRNTIAAQVSDKQISHRNLFNKTNANSELNKIANSRETKIYGINKRRNISTIDGNNNEKELKVNNIFEKMNVMKKSIERHSQEGNIFVKNSFIKNLNKNNNILHIEGVNGVKSSIEEGKLFKKIQPVNFKIASKQR
jgi:hypothetical protein